MNIWGIAHTLTDGDVFEYLAKKYGNSGAADMFAGFDRSKRERFEFLRARTVIRLLEAAAQICMFSPHSMNMIRLHTAILDVSFLASDMLQEEYADILEQAEADRARSIKLYEQLAASDKKRMSDYLSDGGSE